MHRRFRHHLNVALAILLIITVTCTTVPLTAVAGSGAAINAKALGRLKTFPKPGKVPVELSERRTAQTKEYLNPDGSFTIESFAEPVHYKDSRGKWSDIDNELVASDDPTYAFKNKANSFEVSFAEDTKSGDLVRVAKGKDQWLAFSPTQQLQAPGQKLQKPGQSKSQGMKYGLDQNMQLNYTLGQNRLKEEIVLSEYPGTNTFTFTLKTKGLTYIQDTDGLYRFRDEQGKSLFYFERPFAVDADENATTDAELTIEPLPGQGKDQLTITVNDEWLKQAAYPVIIDPSVVEDSDSPNNCSDTFSASAYPTTSYYTLDYVIAGTHPTYGSNNAFVRWDTLPSLPVGASIDQVELRLNMYMDFTDTTTVEVREVTQTWVGSTLNWNNRPEVGSLVTSETGKEKAYWDFDITTLARKWYDGTADNNGVRLSTAPDTANRRSFRSSNATSDRPVLRITYTLEPMGIQSFWGYAANTNVLNGNLVVSATDITLPGRGVPISISRTYNSRSTASGSLGTGWSMNIGMQLGYSDGSSVKLTDGASSDYYFTRQPDGSYKPPIGIYYKLYKEASIYVLEDLSGIKHYFDANGRLDKITDPQGNVTDIVRDGTGVITHAVDPSGRYAEFSYTGARLANIKLNTTPGAYPSIAADELAVSYTYNAANDLETVTKVNEGNDVIITFGYLGSKLNSITDPLGKVTHIGYNADSRVESITKDLDPATSGILDKSGYGQVDSTTPGVSSVTTTLSYQPRDAVQKAYAMVTTVTDPRGNQTAYSANDQGNIEKVVKNPGSATEEIYEMGWDGLQNLLSIRDPKLNDTIMSYDGQGNMLSTRNPAGNSSIYHYNADGDMISSTDEAGRSTINTYDEKRQVMAATNQQFASSGTTRDANGNVTADTTPMTLAENLLPNSGFESWTSGVPTGWLNLTPLPGTLTDDPSSVANGLHAAKIYGQTDAGSGYGRLLAANYTPAQPGERYAVSWSTRTDNMGPNGAGLIVHWYNSNKTWIGWTPLLEPVTGTTGWTRHVALVDSPANTSYFRVELRLKSAGTAWYDNIQTERGSTVNGVNLLTNEGFEVNQDADDVLPDGWWSSSLTSGDGVKTDDKHSGNSAVLVNVATASGKNFGLGVDTAGESIAGIAGTTVTFSGWIKTVSLNTSLPAQLKLKVTYDDETVGWFDAFSASGSHDWQYVENSIVVPKNFTRWSLYGWVGSGSGQAWFDDFALHIYGTSGSSVSDFNMLTNGSFEVDADGSGWPDDWSKNHDTKPGTYDISWVSSSGSFMPYTGSRAVRIQNTPGWVTLGNLSYEQLKDGSTYTATAFVKTENVTTGGAAIKFDVYSGSTLLGQLSSATVMGSKEWHKVSLSYSTEEIRAIPGFSSATRIQFVAQAKGATAGTLYFDGMRMTEKATVTSYAYDSAGNYLTAITNPLGKQVTFAPDAHGNVLTVTDPKDNVSTFTYDDLDRLRTVTNPVNLRTEYEYDENGNLKTVTQLNGISLQSLGTTTSVYNELGLVTKVVDPMNQITEYRYNQNGNLAYVKTQSSKEAWFTYDAHDRLAEVQYLESQVGQMLVFSYDKNGNRTDVVHKTGDLANPAGMTVADQYTYHYAYDGLNRVTQVTLPNSKTVNYTYNPVGQITSISNSTVNMLTYNYDYTGLNTSISEGISGTVNFVYDELGRVTKSTAGTALTTFVDYNAIGQVTLHKTVNAAGVVVAQHVYEYDANGNRTKDASLDGNYVVYEYDAVNELLSEEYRTVQEIKPDKINQRVSYTYDKKGNRLTKAVTVGENTTTTNYSYNDANELTAINGIGVTHEDGNQLDTGTHRLVFNTLGQVTQLLDPGTAEVIEQYQYDADGLRIAKLNGAGEVQEKYFYNGGKLAYVTDGSDKLLYYFTRTASGALLSMVDCTGAQKIAYWYVKDAHGNVVGLTDASGDVVVTYSYDAWGNETSSTGDKTIGDGRLLKDANPFRYSSYYFDETSGLYYLKARYYSPELGRFLSRDPVQSDYRDGLGLNEYAYARSNPATYIDPEGTSPLLVTGGIGALLGGLAGAGYYALTHRKGSFTWGGLTKYALGGALIGGVMGLTAGAAPGVASAATTGLYKTIEQGVNFTRTTMDRMSNPNRYVPVQVLIDAIKHGVAKTDPQGSRGVLYVIEMFRNGKRYTLEVLYDKITNTIWHFRYR